LFKIWFALGLKGATKGENQMSFYRKKPVVIRAWACKSLLNAAAKNWSALPEVINRAYEADRVVFGDTFISISTREGNLRAEKTDMVICGIKGELYPCKPDIFQETYEEIAPETAEAAKTVAQHAPVLGEKKEENE
jgi:hypothetical protein